MFFSVSSTSTETINATFKSPVCFFCLFFVTITIAAWFVGCPAAAVLSLADRGGQTQGLSEWRAGESYSDTVTYRHTAQNKAWSKLDYGPLLAPQLGLLVTLDVKGNEWECRWGSIWARWHRAGTLPGLSHCAISYLILSPYHPLHAGFFFFFFVLLYRVCTDSIYAADCTQINVCVALSMLLKRNQCRSPWCWSWIRTRDVIYSANYKPLPSWLHV